MTMAAALNMITCKKLQVDICHDSLVAYPWLDRAALSLTAKATRAEGDRDG